MERYPGQASPGPGGGGWRHAGVWGSIRRMLLRRMASAALWIQLGCTSLASGEPDGGPTSRDLPARFDALPAVDTGTLDAGDASPTGDGPVSSADAAERDAQVRIAGGNFETIGPHAGSARFQVRGRVEARTKLCAANICVNGAVAP